MPHDIHLLLRLIYCYRRDSELTGRALFTFGQGCDKNTPYAVTEITELSELKAFNSLLLERSGRNSLPKNVTGYVRIAYEHELISATHQYLSSFAQLGVSPPFFVNLALLAIWGYVMYVDPPRTRSRILQQDGVLPPTVKFVGNADFASWEAVARALRPAFDFIWREFGFQRSLNYNKNGDWQAERKS